MFTEAALVPKTQVIRSHLGSRSKTPIGEPADTGDPNTTTHIGIAAAVSLLGISRDGISVKALGVRVVAYEVEWAANLLVYGQRYLDLSQNPG
jgi:hypothetical protein